MLLIPYLSLSFISCLPVRSNNSLLEISFRIHSLNIKVDWSTISYSDFESFCRELLEKMGFRNVRNVGKAEAADGGRDIEAIEYINTLVGVESRKWIFQCKHLKSSIRKKDLFGIRNILEQYNANAFGLLSTGDLTPDTIDYLDSIKSQKVGIMYWNGEIIETELEKHPELIHKYGIKIRS